MNILILGSGGREHAMAWKISQSALNPKIYLAPGNGGTELFGENINLNLSDFEGIGDFVLSHDIDLLVVGPEAPLVEGIRDYFERDAKLKSVGIVGPGKLGAQLEGSKDFAKIFMERHGVPTAPYRTFVKGQLAEAKAYLSSVSPPYVLKADGLAAGKGVLIISDLQEAFNEIEAMLELSKFGAASERVVIEGFLDGIECSVFALTDGNDYVLLPVAKDYKRIGDGDTGLNTGGMGAVSPVPFADATFMQKVEERIVRPTVRGLQHDKIPYRGFIFFGLIKVGNDPFVIEYNVRMGDPETEAVLPRLEGDFLSLLHACALGSLSGLQPEFSQHAAATVVVVSRGYPGDYPKGIEITIGSGLKDAEIFHAGTTLTAGLLRTAGGRVFAATGLGQNIESAIERAYEAVEKIKFDGQYMRRDIGQDLIK